MSKYQEALNYLAVNSSALLINQGNKDTELMDWHYESKNLLQELVDKETPVKVIYENDLVDENIVVDTWAYCPKCKEEILYALWGNLNYCPNCGQKLDWSDNDED